MTHFDLIFIKCSPLFESLRSQGRALRSGIAARGVVLLCLCLTGPVASALTWQLEGESSTLKYVSIKKDHTAEINTFMEQTGESAALSGSISEAGNAILAIDLNTVSTGVEIRNTRLGALLFETAFLPTAYFQTQVDIAAIEQMEPGTTLQQTLVGELSLHGVRQAVEADVLVVKNSSTRVSVTTLQPINIDSKQFDMASGIEALRVVANLSSIGQAVPVYFHLNYVVDAGTGVPVVMPTEPESPTALGGDFDLDAALARLTWQDNSDIETQFLVRRKTVDGYWQTTAELSANTIQLDNNLPEPGGYDFKVIALNNGVPSLPSNILRITATEENPLERGRQTYTAQCAGCHGADGEGIGSFPALNTPRDVAAMTTYISTAMPLGDPGACDLSCAEDVATYVQTLWVTELACDPSQTPVIYGARQLKILTRSEYQNTVEDLLGVDYDAGAGLSPDTQVGFFLNNTHASVSPASYSNFLLVAEGIADWSAQRDFSPALNCSSYDQLCAEQFLADLAPKIFRRPLTEDELTLYRAMAEGIHSSGEVKAGIQMALESMLASPQFLYRHELGEPNPDNDEIDSDAFELTSYEMATFLAYTFTGSTPDQVLLDAAARDELRTVENIELHAKRLADQARPVLGEFVGSWLGTNALGNAAKDAAIWPGFASLVPHLQNEINETFAHVLLEPSEQFAALYGANYTFLNQTLAEHYGIGGVTGADMQLVSTSERGGILANGAFMARWGEAEETSPILRSVRVRRRMLCQDQPDPPAGTFAAREEKLAELSDFLQDPATTNRLKYHRLTEDQPCTNCHEQYINPLGFGMEDFDTVGRVRTTDLKGNPIDATGTLFAPVKYSEVQESIMFEGARGLGQQLAHLSSAQTCLPKQMFRYIMGVGYQNIDSANPEGPQLSEQEKAGYACEIDTLTNAMMTGSPRSMFEAFGSLQAVRYRKAWARSE